MANANMTKILNAPDKDMNEHETGPNGVLAKLFRIILRDLGIGPVQFSYLMIDYVTDARYRVPNNKKDQTDTRGNMTKEFSKAQMTWKVFCKALRFLQFYKFDITIRGYHRNGTESVHEVSVNLGGKNNFQEFITKLEQPENQEPIEDYIPFLDHTSATSDENHVRAQ